MKRSGPPARKTPLRSTKGIKRTAMSRKPSSKQKAHAEEMRTLRAQALERDRCCVLCGWGGYQIGNTEPDLHPHHRKPRGQGGPDTLENLVTLCPACHRFVHENPLEGYRSRLLFHSWDAPPTEAWSR